jgi:hypothetical protein
MDAIVAELSAPGYALDEVLDHISGQRRAVALTQHSR